MYQYFPYLNMPSPYTPGGNLLSQSVLHVLSQHDTASLDFSTYDRIVDDVVDKRFHHHIAKEYQCFASNLNDASAIAQAP